MSIIAFFAGIVIGIYGFFWAAHRFDPQMEAFMDRWYGAPTALLGGSVGLLLISLTLGGLFYQVLP